MNQQKNHIALIGFMGAGKTATGLEISMRTERDFVDTDEFVTQLTGYSIGDIFATQGEAAFREFEYMALSAALQRPVPIIVACGGGIVSNPDSLTLLKSRAVTVYLQIDSYQALTRIDDWTTRPLLAQAESVDAIHELAQSRLALYETAADISVKTDNLDVSRVSDLVIEKLKEAGYAKLLSG